MANPVVYNPKDDVVVSFHNSTSFDFTPEMGCMFDGRAVNGINGAPGIQAGEIKLMPYHIGHRLSVNLAKRIFNTSQAATVDAQGIPTGVAVWSETKLNELAETFVKEQYADAKPVALSETDKLMAKMKELETFIKENVPVKESVAEEVKTETPTDSKVYLDKQEVIAELTKRNIKFDARQNKSNLEKLLA